MATVHTDVIIAAFDAGMFIKEEIDETNGLHTLVISYGHMALCELYVLENEMFRWKRNIAIDSRQLPGIPTVFCTDDMPWLFHFLRDLYK